MKKFTPIFFIGELISFRAEKDSNLKSPPLYKGKKYRFAHPFKLNLQFVFICFACIGIKTKLCTDFLKKYICKTKRPAHTRDGNTNERTTEVRF